MRTTTRLVAILAGGVLALAAPVVAMADDASPSPSPSTSASDGPNPSDSASPSESPSSADPGGPGTSKKPPTDGIPSIYPKFLPNPAPENSWVTLRVVVEDTGVGGTVTIDGLGGPLSIRYAPEEYPCEATAPTRITCEMPPNLDHAVYTTTLSIPNLDNLPLTKTVTVTAETDDEYEVTKDASLTIVDATSTSPSPSHSASPSASTTVTASPSTSPVSGTGDLPVTGGPLVAIGATAGALLAAGAALLAVTYRRRRQE